MSATLPDLLRVGEGFRLADVDPSSTPGFSGDKDAGAAALTAEVSDLDRMQEKLYANGVEGDPRRVLLVLQALDTAGKSGIVRHVVGSVDPQGVKISAFKAPTAEERAHDFLWRVRPQVPPPGFIGVFDRSHYEDVLIQRVHGTVKPAVIEDRYGKIVAFEKELAADGVSIIKVMLHITPEEQKKRLQARLDEPDKHWKFRDGDLHEREYWAAYMDAYQIALTRTSTPEAPWYVVPANRKWYARLAVQRLLADAITALNQSWPAADFDVAAARAELAASNPVAFPE